MLKLKKRTLGISYYFSLLVCCCWIVNSNVANGQEPQNIGSALEVTDTEREFDFEVGSIESLTAKTITVNGEQFFITADTQYTDSEGTPIYETSHIKEGSEVAISFYPYEDTAFVIELVPDKSEQMQVQKQTPPEVTKRKKQAIVLKNGVYRN